MQTFQIIAQKVRQPFVEDFLETFPKGNVYLVGGSLRDAFLNIVSTDFDFVFEGIGDSELIEFLEKHGRVVAVYGHAFGVVKFKPTDSSDIYDIALPRREQYISGQRRKNAAIELKNVSIIEDLQRRDFTINAMALDLRAFLKTRASRDLLIKNIIDPFEGLTDLKKGLIKAVGDPSERLNEDPTRVLRGIRFAVQFRFEIEKETLRAMKDLAPEIVKKFKGEKGNFIQRVSCEMIGLEFMKSIIFNPSRTIELYDKTGLLNLLLPEVQAMKGVAQPANFHAEGDVYIHTLLALAELPNESSFTVKLATLLHDIGKVDTYQSQEETKDRIRFNSHPDVGADLARKICHRFCYSNEITDEVVWLVQNHIKIFFSLLKMRPEKQKAFIRHRYFKDLLVLAKADTLASLGTDKKPNLENYQTVLNLAKEIWKLDENRPVEIINGKEIIEFFKKEKGEFDQKKYGRLVGALKKKINTLYDRGEINSQKEAYELLFQLVFSQKSRKNLSKKKEE